MNIEYNFEIEKTIEDGFYNCYMPSIDVMFSSPIADGDVGVERRAKALISEFLDFHKNKIVLYHNGNAH